MRKTLLLCIFLFCTGIARAEIVTESPDSRVFFGDKIEYHEDRSNRSFSEIIKQKSGWQSSSLRSISFGLTKSVYWMRFDLENKTNEKLFLTFNTINNDRINLYILTKDGAYTEKTGGSCYPFNQREVYDKDIFFVIPEFKGRKTIYARFETKYVLTIIPEIVTEDKTTKRTIDTYLPAVFSHGIFFALLIYHLFVFISSREKSYLFLVLMIASFQLYDLVHDGLGYMFVWPGSVAFENLVLPLSIGLIGITSGLFIQHSIETRKHFRIVYQVINFLIFTGLILCLLSFTAERSFAMAFTLFYALFNTLITICLLFYTGIIKRNRAALFIFIAYVLFEGGNAVSLASTNPVLIKEMPFLNNFILILTISKYIRVAFVLIFSFVLTDKISIMKKSLEISEETYRSIFNGTSEAVCILDTENFTVTDANRTMLELFTVDYDEVKGKTSDYFSSAEDGYTDEKIHEAYKEALNNKTVHTEGVFKKRTGEKFWADITINNVLINGEDMLMVIIRDISDRKKAEEEKEKMMQQLTQAQKMEAVGSLAGGLAHDFNNFLTGILGSSSITKTFLDDKTPEKEKIMEYLNIIEELSLKASGTVKRLLTITRKHELNFSPADLNVLLKNVVDVCLNSFPKSVSIETKYPDAPAMINADKTGIEQVFLNILVNASHAVTIMRDPSEREGGIVSLKIERQYADDIFCRINKDAVQGINYFAVSIQDNGCGIGQDALDKIFDPFFTTKSATKGSGLGLSMVYTIVSRHRGLIKVYSETGHGTTFIVYLPEDTSGERAETEEKKSITRGQGRILVIDDEEFVRKIAKDILVYSGYEVITASDGAQGIEIYGKNTGTIDLVLLDMSMPGLSGLDTFAELKRIRSDVKVIISSGFSMDERVQQALELGISSFIQKPYTNIELSKAVHDVLVNE